MLIENPLRLHCTFTFPIATFMQTICTITNIQSHKTQDIDVGVCAIVTFATVAALVVCFVTVPLPPSPSRNPRPDTPHLHKEI